MKPHTIIHLSKRITTQSGGVQAAYTLEKGATVPVLVLPCGLTQEQVEIIEALAALMKQVLDASSAGKLQTLADKSALTDDMIRAWWESMGGEFFGPKVEHAESRMKEVLFLPLMRGLLAGLADRVTRAPVRSTCPACQPCVVCGGSGREEP